MEEAEHAQWKADNALVDSLKSKVKDGFSLEDTGLDQETLERLVRRGYFLKKSHGYKLNNNGT
jgi:hypothetical protein